MGEVLTLAESGREKYYSVPSIAVENNLLAFPIFLISHAAGGRKGSFSYKTIMVLRPEDGDEPRRVEQEWIVQGGHRYGLMRALDLDVYMALTETAELQGGMPDDGRVYFTFWGIRELLGWRDSGRANELIRESIERTAAASITSKRAFWSPRRGGYVSETFSLYRPSIKSAWDSQGRTSERHHVRFDELVVESYQDGYIGRLDPAFFRTLNQSTAKRLYMLGDHHCGGGGNGRAGVWEIEPFDLMERMPLARYDRAKKVEEVLDKGHEELVHSGYFKDVEIERGKRNTPVLFRYVQSPAFARKRLGEEIERDPAGAVALAKLAAERVNRAVAVDLVGEFGASFCTKQAELLPFIPKVKSGQGAGMLVKAIRNRWPWEERVARLPKGRPVASVPGVPTPPKGEGDSGSGWNAYGKDRVPEDVVGEIEDASKDGNNTEPDPPDIGAQEAWSALVKDLGEAAGLENISHWSNCIRAVRLQSGSLGLEAENGAAGTEMVQTAGDELLRLWREREGDAAAIELWSALRPESRIILDRDGARKVTADEKPEDD